jgi:FkbM family methyltransferase
VPAIDSNLEEGRGLNQLRYSRGAGVSGLRDRLKMLWGKWRYLTVQEAYLRDPALTVSRLLSWRTRCLLRRPAIASLRRWNLQMFLPANWRGVEKLIFAFREYYEPELAYLEQLLSPGMTFIDAGANIGVYTLVASRIVGDRGRVIAFEPSAQSFPVLQRNIALNRLTNVLAFPFALTQTSGRTRLYRGPNAGLNSLGSDPSWPERFPSWREEVEEIATEPLDGVLHRTSTNRVHVVKMDVQGAEELVLRGGINTVKVMRPRIIFEIFPEGTAPIGLSPYGAWNLLESLGYEFFLMKGRALYHTTSPPTGGNVVGIPREQK